MSEMWPGRRMETLVLRASDLPRLIAEMDDAADREGAGIRRVVFVDAWEPDEGSGDDFMFDLLLRRCGQEIIAAVHRGDEGRIVLLFRDATVPVKPDEWVEVVVPSRHVWNGTPGTPEFEIVPPDLWEEPS